MGTLYKRGGKGKYYGEFTAPDGSRVRRSTGTTIKNTAARILAQWEEEANMLGHGVPLDGILLADLIEEFVGGLGDDTYRVNTEQRIKRVVNANGWTMPRQINQASVEKTVREFRNARNAKHELSNASKAHHITAMKMFTRWLHRVKKALAYDPLEMAKKPNPEKDRKRVRRFLLPDEWRWLSMTDNALLYETAIETGLRSSELRALRSEHIKADHILLPAKWTKNGEPAKQYITKDLRARLVDALPFELPPREDMAAMLYRDLATARELWVAAGGKRPKHFLEVTDAEGKVLDFHALRHTCGAWLAIANVNAKVIQKVMRHSTIVLTLDTYGHLMPGETQGVVEKLGQILAEQKALGTKPLPIEQTTNETKGKQ